MQSVVILVNLTKRRTFKMSKKQSDSKKIRFGENESCNVIHGKNVKAYITDLTPEFYKELEERSKELKSKILSFATDDDGNIDCFLAVFGKYIKYNTDKGTYYYWTGRVWREDHENRILLWIQTAMRLRRDYSYKLLKKNATVKNFDVIKAHIKGCCNQRSIKAIYDGAKSAVSCKDCIFDTKLYLLNTLNGTVNLKNGEIKEHSYQNYITKLIPHVYDPNAKSKVFKKFLEDTFDNDPFIQYVQRLLGYCLTGETREQVIHFLLGCGANGKSTLLAILQYILCDYAAVIPAKVLTSIDKAGSASSELAQLPHKRLVCCSELNCNDYLNEGKIKIMSSGETLSVRQLYSEAFTYEPEFKCIIDSNYLPCILGTDHGIWRRIRVIPFKYTVPKEKMNKYLLEELKSSNRGILNWLVKGAIEYYEKGLEPCEEVEKATKAYRKSQDTLGSFIHACVKESEGSSVRARQLYEAYCAYCSDNFLTPMSETKFGKDLASLDFKRAKDKISRKYLNIKLVS